MCKGDQINLLYHIYSFPNHPTSLQHDGLDSNCHSDGDSDGDSDGEDKVDEKEDNEEKDG